MKRKWQKIEIEYLKNNYSSMKIPEIAKILNRGNASIHHKAKALGLINNDFFWTEDQIEYVKNHYEGHNGARIALKLNKSINAVRRVASQLNITKDIKRWNEDEIEYLKTNYAIKPLEEMAKYLNASIVALKAKAQKSGYVRQVYVEDAYCIDCGCKINKYFHTERCITCSNKYRSGSKHSNWQGGISKLTDMIRQALYLAWTLPIMERDNFTCQVCGQTQNNHVHHIKPLKEIRDEVLKNNPELSIDDSDDKIKITALVIAQHEIGNGITVCNSCHRKIHYSENGVNCLGSLSLKEADNQQPSLSSNALEGSQTNLRLLPGKAGEGNEDTSAPQAISAIAG